MRIALLTERVRRDDEWPGLQPQPEDILADAIEGGARAINQQKLLGGLEVGKKADLLVVNTLRPYLVPAGRLVSAWIHSGHPSDIESVMVDGQFVVKSGRVLTMDEDAIVREADRVSKRIWIRCRSPDRSRCRVCRGRNRCGRHPTFCQRRGRRAWNLARRHTVARSSGHDLGSGVRRRSAATGVEAMPRRGVRRLASTRTSCPARLVSDVGCPSRTSSAITRAGARGSRLTAGSSRRGFPARSLWDVLLGCGPSERSVTCTRSVNCCVNCMRRRSLRRFAISGRGSRDDWRRPVRISPGATERPNFCNG